MMSVVVNGLESGRISSPDLITTFAKYLKNICHHN